MPEFPTPEQRAVLEELDRQDMAETLRELDEAGELEDRRLFAVGRSHPTPELRAVPRLTVIRGGAR